MATVAASKLPTIQSSHITEKSHLANGSFGHIYICKWQGVKCALKVIKDSEPTSNWALNKLVKEITLLKSLGDQTKLFVKVHGLFIDDVKFTGYLMEFCEFGDMRHFLARFTDNNLETRRFPWLVHSIMEDVCTAMRCLQEEQERPIFHRDLALDNILITTEFRAKLADFGMSKRLNSLMSTETLDVEQKTAFERRPPELIADPLRQPDEFVDRFLFGICLVEALVCSSLRQRVACGVEDYKRMVTSGEIGPRLRTMAERECFDLYPVSLQVLQQAAFDSLRAHLLDTLEACVARDPATRPGFGALSAGWTSRLPHGWQNCLQRERSLVQRCLIRDGANANAAAIGELSLGGVEVGVGRVDGGVRRLDSGVGTVSSNPVTGDGGGKIAWAPPNISIGRVRGSFFVHQLRPGEVAEPSPLLGLRFSDAVPASAELLNQLAACAKLQEDWGRLARALGLPQSLEDSMALEECLPEDEAVLRVLREAEAASVCKGLTLRRLGDALKALNCHQGLQVMRQVAEPGDAS